MENKELINEIIEIINNIRTNTNEGISIIKEYEDYYKEYQSTKKKEYEQIKNIQKSLSNKSSKKLDEIIENDKLTHIANLILSEKLKKKTKKIYPDSEEVLNATLNYYFIDVIKSKNFISTEHDPKKIIQDIITNEFAIDSGHHYLFEPKISNIGIANSSDEERCITVIILSDSVTEREDLNLDITLLYDINNLRKFPMICPRLLDSPSEDLYQLINGIKPSPELRMNQYLTKAAEDRLNSLDKINNSLKNEKLAYYLQQFGSGNICSEEVLIMESFESNYDLIKTLISNPNFIMKILNRRVKEIGYAFNSDNNQGVIFLANRFDPPSEDSEILIESLNRKLMRPKMTEDELLQIKNDFKKFDVLHKGVVIPKTIILFMDKTEDFKNQNPWYYQAFKNLNNEDNNKHGIDVNVFIEEVQKVIGGFNRNFDENWGNIFDQITDNGELIDKDILSNLVMELGYKSSKTGYNKDTISNLLDKLDGDIDKQKFIDICKIVEFRFANKNKNIV